MATTSASPKHIQLPVSIYYLFLSLPAAFNRRSKISGVGIGSTGTGDQISVMIIGGRLGADAGHGRWKRRLVTEKDEIDLKLT